MPLEEKSEGKSTSDEKPPEIVKEDIDKPSETGNPPDRLNELEYKLTVSLAGIDMIVKRIEAELVTKIQKDRTQKEAFEKLYEEMRQYKENFVKTAFKPVMLDLILLYDNMQRTEKNLEGEAKKAIGDLKEELLEILYRRDVEPVIERPEFLDKDIQKAIQVIPTEEETEDRRVVEIVRDGFRWEDRVLRPQEVVVKRSSKCTRQ